jgi:hypothetical protein
MLEGVIKGMKTLDIQSDCYLKLLHQCNHKDEMKNKEQLSYNNINNQLLQEHSQHKTQNDKGVTLQGEGDSYCTSTNFHRSEFVYVGREVVHT